MGQRGKTAAFMPEKFVFPGGAVDAGDPNIPLAAPLSDTCQSRLAAHNTGATAHALGVAAIRELWEEAGLRLGQPAPWTPPTDWQPFHDGQHAPNVGALRFFFRAITPPGRPRRFDARFFLADATALQGDPDDFSSAEDELAHLRWVSLEQARSLNLPFITRVVLGELQRHLPSTDAPKAVPFVTNDQMDNSVIWL